MTPKPLAKNIADSFTQSPSQRAKGATDSSRCFYSTSDGRRCTMLLAPKHRSLCVFHARQEQQILEADRIAAELATLSGEFRTATDLNHVLGKLFALLAAQRIPVRNAVVLGYLAQLILQTLSTVRWENERAQGFNAWEQMLRRYFGKPAPAGKPQSPAPQAPKASPALPVAVQEMED